MSAPQCPLLVRWFGTHRTECVNPSGVECAHDPLRCMWARWHFLDPVTFMPIGSKAKPPAIDPRPQQQEQQDLFGGAA